MNKTVKIIDSISGIYKIQNTETGKCYIGQSKDIKKRWQQHLYLLKKISTPLRNFKELGINMERRCSLLK